MQITIQANLQWAFHKSAAGYLIGECEPLGLTLQADDQEELMSLINEAQHLLFLDLLEDGELDRFLHQRGWTASRALPPNPVESGVQFSAPFKLVPAQHASA